MPKLAVSKALASYNHEIGTIVLIRRVMDGLSQDLRARRKQLGLRQRELAALAGTSERFIRELEHGKPSVRLDKVNAVLDVLGLEMRAELRTKPAR